MNISVNPWSSYRGFSKTFLRNSKIHIHCLKNRSSKSMDFQRHSQPADTLMYYFVVDPSDEGFLSLRFFYILLVCLHAAFFIIPVRFRHIKRKFIFFRTPGLKKRQANVIIAAFKSRASSAQKLSKSRLRKEEGAFLWKVLRQPLTSCQERPTDGPNRHWKWDARAIWAALKRREPISAQREVT